MGYILGQYNFNSQQSAGDLNTFMTYITNATVKTRPTVTDSGISGGSSFNFDNVCITNIDGGLQPNINYYFHGKIKRLSSAQVIYIKLVNYDEATSEVKEQYIKTITIAGSANATDWVDVEFIFNPFVTFDTILFELQRTLTDDYPIGRTVIVAFEEISIINNLINSKVGLEGTELIKIGVQSRPSFMMCVNGEEIHTSRSGIYELKSGVILVSFFAPVGFGKETTTALEDWQNEVNQRVIAGETNIPSQHFLGTNKDRQISNFTLDYIYKE